MLTWRVETTPKVPVLDAVRAAVVRPLVNRLLKGVVQESERARTAALSRFS